jgi:hypothetical protein
MRKISKILLIFFTVSTYLLFQTWISKHTKHCPNFGTVVSLCLNSNHLNSQILTRLLSMHFLMTPFFLKCWKISWSYEKKSVGNQYEFFSQKNIIYLWKLREYALSEQENENFSLVFLVVLSKKIYIFLKLYSNQMCGV